MPIRVLPADLVQQIAAGEVVERPASVVKELVENALDAGARRVDVRIRCGGRESIEIVDDGCGIDPGDLPLSLAAHATSKISAGSDLEALRTFGFRGEALAAIAGVAHVRIRSRCPAARDAYCIESRFGTVGAVRPASGAAGTAIEVLGLFGNVPARRKFLKSDPAEAARVTEAVTNAALAHPAVAFSLESSGREVFALAPAPDQCARVLEVFPDVLGADPLRVHGAVEFDGIAARVQGLACRPERLRAVSRTQRIFVNGRPVVDRSLQHAVREAYRGRAAPQLQPSFVLFIEIDPHGVDVNVHPQKTEVRWRNAPQMHRMVHHAVAAALDSTAGRESGERLLGTGPHIDSAAPAAIAAAVMGVAVPAPSVRTSVFPPLPRPQRSAWQQQGAPQHAERTAAGQPLVVAPAHEVDVLLVDDTWIVHAEDGAIVITDQHALHERVMFGEIRRRIASGALQRQRLLVPVPVAVPPEALVVLERIAPLLERIGIEAEPAGPRSVAVHAFPVFLIERRVEPGAFVAQVLCDEAIACAVESGQLEHAQEAALAEVLDMKACKAAVKAGDRLSRAEALNLIARGAAAECSTHCPHGRPTSVRIALEDIERRFGRR